MAEALYRKYRPQTFGDVVGQDHIEDTLRNAIQQDKVSHAYLFCGPRGTGKTTTARLLAKALLCQHGEGDITPNPDGTCEDCQLIAAGEHPDVYELDAASRTGVENVREEIIGRVQFAPTRGKYKVYIIDEVHMLSTAAFNALLKTLEEPPSHVVFVLATTDPQKVPETIHSRCQRFDFRRIGTEGMVARLGAVCQQEGVEFEGEALELIAHRAEGGMRNALTSLEQLIAFGKGKVTLEVAEHMLGSIDSSDMAEIMQAIGNCDAAACFCWVAAYVETGADLAQFAKDMAAHVRNLYVMSLAGASVALEVSETERVQLVKELPLFGPDRLARLLGVLGDVSAELKTSTNPRLSFEIALTRMVRPESELTLEALAERIERLERSGVPCVTESSYKQSCDTVSDSVSAVQMTAAVAPVSQPAVQTTAAVAPVSQPAAQTTAVAASNVAPAAVSVPAAPDAPAEATVSVKQNQPVMVSPASVVVPSEAPSVGAAAGESVHVGEAGAHENAPVRTAPQVSVSAVVSDGATCEGIPAQLLETWQNPAALQRMWAGVLAALKKHKAAYGVLFLNTKAAVDSSGKTLQIEFAPDNVFAFKAVQKPEVQESVAAALQQVVGTAIPFSYVQRNAANVTSRVSSTSAAPATPSAPVAPVMSSVSATPAMPSALAASAMSSVSVKPVVSSAPEVPRVPVASSVPAASTEPVAPAVLAAPVAPREPEEPVAPAAPVVPEVPVAPATSVVPEVPMASAAPAAPVAPAVLASEPRQSTGIPLPDTGSREYAPWEDAPEPEYVPLDAYDASAHEPMPWEDDPVPNPDSQVLPSEPTVDTYTSATMNDPGLTLGEIKDAITSAFGDGVVFQTIDEAE